jgi:hypothetical protein
MGKTNNKKVSYRQIKDYYCIACSCNLANSQILGSIIGLALRETQAIINPTNEALVHACIPPQPDKKIIST